MDPYRNVSDLLYFDNALAPGMLIDMAKVWWAEIGRFPTNYAKTMDLLIENELIVELGSRVVAAMNEEDLPPEYLYTKEMLSPWLKGQYFRCDDLSDFIFRTRRPEIQLVPRFGTDDFLQQKRGKRMDLSALIIDQLPMIKMEEVNPKAFVDFLLDNETQRRKLRLFVWQNELENNLLKETIEISDIYDIIASSIIEYQSWLKKSGMLLHEVRREFIFTGLLSVLSVVGIPKAAEKYFRFRRKRIKLQDYSIAPGSEVAHIVHTNSQFRP